MVPSRNFPKALIATGLAAALVGCGGSSSDDTAMEGSSQAQSQEEMNQKQMEAHQQAISAAKAAFSRAQSTLQTALASATTDQQRIAAYEVMKSASDAFRDALYQNDGSAADLLIATNAYDRATSEISKLEMMIADDKMEDDERRRQMALDIAKQTYDGQELAFNLVLNDPNSDNDDIFNARVKFKNDAATYLNVLIANEGVQDDKVQAEKVLVELAIDDNNGQIHTFIAMSNSDLTTTLRSLNEKDPTEAQIKRVNAAINKLSERVSAANLISAARSPYNVIISNARTRVNEASALALRLQGEAKDYYDAIGPNASRKNDAAEYSDDLDTAPIEINKEINVTIRRTPTTLKPNDTLSPLRGWSGEKFTGGNIEAHVYSNSQSYATYYAGDFNSSVPNQLATDFTEDPKNRRFIELTGIRFDSSNALAKIIPNSDNGDTLVRGRFNGVEGIFTCVTPDEVCGAQRRFDGGIALGEATADDEFETGNAVWTFMPNNPRDMVASYTSFGYWIQMDDDGPASIGSFRGFTGREKEQDTTVNSIDISRIITGSATYNGGAAGRYAFYKAESTDKSHHGEFTADVTLEADFANDTIEGTIDNFMTTDYVDNKKRVNWQVDLESTHFDEIGQIGISTTSGDATWIIDGEEHENQSSRWSGGFSDFVDATPDGTPNTDALSDAPGTVTGQFSTYASDDSGEDFARLVGAFGADKD